MMCQSRRFLSLAVTGIALMGLSHAGEVSAQAADAPAAVTKEKKAAAETAPDGVGNTAGEDKAPAAESEMPPTGEATSAEASASVPEAGATGDASTAAVPAHGTSAEAARAGEPVAPPASEEPAGLEGEPIVPGEDDGELSRKQKHVMIISYDMAVPVGDSWAYIGAFSPRGLSFNYRYHLTPELAVGGFIGWNNFEIKEKDTFHYGPVTVTGTQIRSMDVMHFGANFNYNILPITRKLVPFIGVDLGAYHIWRVTDFGWWTAGSNAWHFGFAPGLGVLVRLRSVELMFGSKFQMAVKTSEAPTDMYVSFNIGIGLD